MNALLPYRFDGPSEEDSAASSAPHAVSESRRRGGPAAALHGAPSDGAASSAPHPGRVLLLLNGGAMSMAAWDPVMAGLTHLRVLRCDLRGQLLCPVAPPATIEEHASDVAALLDGLGLESVHVAGTSYGAFVAMALAARHPDHVRSLSLVTASETLTREMHDASANLRTACVRAARGEADAAREVFDDLFSFAYSPPYRQRNAALLAARRAAADRLPPVWFEGLAGLFEALLAFDPAPHVRAVRAPTLVVGAAADAVFPIEHSRALAAALGGLGAEEFRSRRRPHGTGDGLGPAPEPDGGLGAEEFRSRRSAHGIGDGLGPAPEPDIRLEIVADSGHALVVEQPQALAALIAEFVAAADNGAKA